MKTTLVLLLLVCALPVFAQEQTLLGTGSIENGGYGAVVTKFTSVNGHFGLLIGGRGGWIINHSFALGAAVYGLANNVRANTPGPDGQPYLDLGYGGLDLEYIYRSNDVVHVSIHTLIGAGAAGYRYSLWAPEPPYSDMHWGFPLGGGWQTVPDRAWENDYNEWPHQWKAFFVFEPGANLDLNLTTWMRTSVGASFRVVSGLHWDAATNRDLSGPSAMISFRFGSF